MMKFTGGTYTLLNQDYWLLMSVEVIGRDNKLVDWRTVDLQFLLW